LHFPDPLFVNLQHRLYIESIFSQEHTVLKIDQNRNQVVASEKGDFWRKWRCLQDFAGTLTQNSNLFLTEARSRSKRREDDVGKKPYNVKRSEPVPLERRRCMSEFLPRAPLARAVGAEESCIYLPTGWREGEIMLFIGKGKMGTSISDLLPREGF